MQSRTRLYVTIVAFIAALATGALYAFQPEIASGAWTAIGVLAVLAIGADLLSYALPQSAIGSISFIPFFAAAVIVPAWPTVVVLAVIRLVFEITSKRELTKRIFNVAQQALSEAAAIWIYLGLGGHSLLDAQGT